MTGYRISNNHAVHLFEECQGPRCRPLAEHVQLVQTYDGEFVLLDKLTNLTVKVPLCSHCRARHKAAA